MAFRFTKSNCIALGTFNIYIIQPHWLTEVGIFPDNIEVTVETNLTQPGFRLSSSELNTVWRVSPTRLVLESRVPAEDCGALMAQVLSKLPWTPISAVGNNVVFEGTPEDVRNLTLADACNVTWPIPNGYERRRHGLGLSLARDERLFNLTLNVGTDTASLLVNVHTALTGQINAAKAQDAAAHFLADLLEAETLLGALFGAEIENVAPVD